MRAYMSSALFLYTLPAAAIFRDRSVTDTTPTLIGSETFRNKISTLVPSHTKRLGFRHVADITNKVSGASAGEEMSDFVIIDNVLRKTRPYPMMSVRLSSASGGLFYSYI